VLLFSQLDTSLLRSSRNIFKSKKPVCTGFDFFHQRHLQVQLQTT
jgi:hypothetical protein